MAITVRFTVTETLEEKSCTSTDRDSAVHIMMEFYSDIKMNESVPSAGKWMELWDIL